jgi:Flp pilus assembly protein TadD
LRAIATVLIFLLAAGCTRGMDESAPASDDARARALIDAGNLAYGAGDYELAARRFGAAAVVNEHDPAAYFGLGMSLSKLGRDDDARVAYARARRLMQEQQQDRRAAPEPFGTAPGG